MSLKAMKQKILLMSFIAALATVLFADEYTTVRTADGTVTKMKKSEVRQRIYKHFGGNLKVPGKQKGKVVIVDSAKDVPQQSLDAVIKQFDDSIHIAIEVQKGEFSFESPKIQGEATIFIVDDVKLPMSLVAPESRWALVNVAKLKSEKPQFYDARIRKETVRTLVALLGGCNSTYPDALTGCVLRAEDLDRFADTRLQVEIEQRLPSYIEKLGITPYVMTSYRKACEEGWAPAPTNDVQKAIWDKVHALPTEPIKIKPEEKKTEK